MVTHTAIDGYSRLIVFLKCFNNNKSSTVYQNFLEAVNTYGLPSRIRTDQGRENILIAQHMLENRGLNRASVLTGSSVHNQRVERLWRDMHDCVTKLFYRLFYYLEELGILNPDNGVHIFSLHYIYLPRINEALALFRNGWNMHGIRTEHNLSPTQLFVAGALRLRSSGLTALDFLIMFLKIMVSKKMDYPQMKQKAMEFPYLNVHSSWIQNTCNNCKGKLIP